MPSPYSNQLEKRFQTPSNSFVPLSGWTIHDNVDPKNLHRVQGIRDTHQSSESDQRKGSYAGT